MLNSIYVARVAQIVPNIGAAFVEIAKGQPCFLPLKDLHEPIYVKRLSKKPLVSGDELLVQVVREPVKTKEPQVTTNLALAGVYCVVTIGERQLGISSKIPADRRKELRELALRLEIEASVYQQMNTPEGRLLADDRLTRAAEVKEAFEHFIHL